MRDYERYFEENARLHSLVSQYREERDSSNLEVNRLKHIHNDRVGSLTDEANEKVASLENHVLD